MENSLLFVHIPKTGGTSFKFSLKQYFGEENILSDYSPESVETSKEVLKYIYGEKDPYKFYNVIQKKKFLLGHFHVGKYMHMFPTLNVVTFLRNPVDQVVSHYQHWHTYNNYKKSIEEFISEERFKNMQTKYLQAKPLELFGFIGIVERYSDAIELFNYTYGVNLQNIHTNKASMKLNIDNKLKEMIIMANKKDMALYEKAVNLFEDRLLAYKQQEAYLYRWIQQENEKKIVGVAFQKDSSNPAVVDMYGTMTVAKDFRPGLLVHNLPRNGFVGFQCTKNHNRENRNGKEKDAEIKRKS